MGMSDLSKYSGKVVRLYVAALLLGVIVGFSTDIGQKFNYDAGSALYELSWPLGGMLLGMAWAGFGPIIVLFAAGLYVSELIKSYMAAGGTLLVSEGAVSSQLITSTVNMARGSMEALAFLYGAVGGMYLALHYAEIFEYGTSIDDTAKRNFIRKLGQGLMLALVAAALRVVAI